MIEFNHNIFAPNHSNHNNVVKLKSVAPSFFVAGVEKNDNGFSIEDVIERLENGERASLAELDKNGISYTLEEREDGYKTRFENDGIKYTISYVDSSFSGSEKLPVEPPYSNVKDATKEELNQIIDTLFRQGETMFQEFEKLSIPTPPLVSEYPEEKDYAQAYEQYQDDVDMYDKHLLEYNKKIAGLHLASDVYETQAEMLDYIEKVQSVEIPSPPILTDDMSESEYNELMKIYEKELAEYKNQSYLYDLRGKMLNVKMSSTMAILNWLTSKMNF